MFDATSGHATKAVGENFPAQLGNIERGIHATYPIGSQSFSPHGVQEVHCRLPLLSPATGCRSGGRGSGKEEKTVQQQKSGMKRRQKESTNKSEQRLKRQFLKRLHSRRSSTRRAVTFQQQQKTLETIPTDSINRTKHKIKQHPDHPWDAEPTGTH